MYLLKVFKSGYCQLTFVLFLAAGYFLTPKLILNGWQFFLAALFIFLFALVLTCLVRNVKEKAILARKYKSSLIGIIAAALGLAALQACGFGAPVCGASIGVGIMSAVFPGVFVNFFSAYSVYIIIFSIIFQFLALYFMNCFKEANI